MVIISVWEGTGHNTGYEGRAERVLRAPELEQTFQSPSVKGPPETTDKPQRFRLPFASFWSSPGWRSPTWTTWSNCCPRSRRRNQNHNRRYRLLSQRTSERCLLVLLQTTSAWTAAVLAREQTRPTLRLNILRRSQSASARSSRRRPKRNRGRTNRKSWYLHLPIRKLPIHPAAQAQLLLLQLSVGA